MLNQKELAVLILAAGESRRMGAIIKQLLPWKDTTLLGHSIQQAKKISDKVFVVLGANKERIKSTLRKDLTIIENPNWNMGMGTSIAIGVSEIAKNSTIKAVLLLLTDQPLLEASYFLELKENFSKSECNIVATSYDNKNGVPAIFDASLFSELGTLNKDYGARKIMRKHIYSLKSVNPNGKAIDIDTPETYEQLKNQINNEV
jgi:molybdenum cofactor cytidylyltransferase